MIHFNRGICKEIIQCRVVYFQKDIFLFTLARWRRPPAAFLLNKAITRGANVTKTFRQICPSYMQSFIKIGVPVLEKSVLKTMTLCNLNKDEMEKIISD